MDIEDAEGNKIGTVTSGSHAPSLGKSVGMCYVPPKFAKVLVLFFGDESKTDRLELISLVLLEVKSSRLRLKRCLSFLTDTSEAKKTNKSFNNILSII